MRYLRLAYWEIWFIYSISYAPPTAPTNGIPCKNLRYSSSLENCALVCSAGSDFGGPQWGNWVRVNEATNPAVVLEAVDRMAEWLRTL